ncbi:MAG: methyltransferase domain-containing protein [Vicinamibacterales bacterium]
MATRPTLRVIAVLGFCAGVVLACALPARGQSDREDAARLVAALGIAPGSAVAEVGAGSGALTVAMARAVGPTGRVFSNELNPRQRAATERAVAAAGLTNVTVVEGRAAETNMPAACCQALFMRDVFHHVENRAAMSRSLLATLAPGGRLGILDFAPRGRHGITADEVRATLEAAGFADVRLEAAGARWYLVVAAKPVS